MTQEITFTFKDGSDHVAEPEKIGGRGDPGDQNLGAGDGDTEDVAEEQAAGIREHVGEPVLLSGGGGAGVDIAILDGVAVEESPGGGYKPKAELDLVYGRLTRTGRETFTPWIGSWHLSAFTGDDLDVAEEWTEEYRTEN